MRIRTVLFLAALVVVIVSIWLSFPAWLPQVFSIPGEKGTFGDSFGALNTLFSGLAFAGIIVSIVLQSRELRDTRTELQGQKEQFIIQNASLKKQVFENTFFQLIQLHNEITASIKTMRLSVNEKEVMGRAAIGELYNKFVHREHRLYFPDLPKPDNRADDYDLFYQIYHEKIGHYFHNIYELLKFIDESEVDNKKFYASLLRAQLSSDELCLLFFNCISSVGKAKLKPLAERYCLLERLPLYPDFTKELANLFQIEAFGENEEWKLFLAM